MQYRNPQYTADGRIDCEIEHPRFGWIPTTLAPGDPVNGDLFEEVDQLGNAAAYVAPPEPTEAEILAGIRARTRLARSAFCIAAKEAGILTKGEAVQAARGDIPQLLTDALAAAVTGGLITQGEADNAEILWAALIEVERNHQFIQLLQSHLQWTDAQVDALFGISPT